MAACVRNVFNGCVKDAIPQSQVRAQLAPFVKEEAFCIDGPLAVMGDPKRFAPVGNLTCNSNYNQSASLCGKTVLETFVANRADSSLCRLVCPQVTQAHYLCHVQGSYE